MANKIHLPHKEIVTKWKEEKVIKWLKRVHLEDCIPAFEVRHIDGEKLLELTEQKLFTYQDLKIKHRKQIAKCVQECKSQASNAKRIARTIKQKKDSSLEGEDISDTYDSEEDVDDWGSDFDDEEETDSLVCELNNNTIDQFSMVSNSGEPSRDDNSNTDKGLLGNFIPKPPDIPVIPAVANSSIPRNVPSHKNSIPRPPVKRPPGQPPPPPVVQVSSQELEQEDYEIPIVSTTPVHRESSEHSDSPVHCLVSREETSIETYELIVPPEETYEIVDTPNHSLGVVVEKPVLPPRIPLSSSSVSLPPPLPQKPKKIKANMAVLEKSTEVRTCPKPFSKTEMEALSSSVSSIGFIGTLIGRRSSNTSSPKTLQKMTNGGALGSNHSVVSSSDGLSSRSSSPDKDVGHPPFLTTSSTTLNITKTAPLPPLPNSGAALVSDEAAQNMATRPLPPVPKVERPAQENLQAYPWYHEMERQEAEEVVRHLNESGSFVVRPSKRAGIENPFSITIFHDEKLFHLNIRHRPDNKFALGKEKKKEKTFSSVADLIAFHQQEPILLTSRGEPAGKTILSKYPQKSSS